MTHHDEDITHYIDTWGLYPLLSTTEADPNVHPDDFEVFRSIEPHGRVFHCIDVEDEYLILVYRDQKYRVKSTKYYIVSKPRYSIFEPVIDPNHPESVGFVRDIAWHSKYQKHMYFIELDGKNKSKRYFEEDLLAKT